MNVVQADGHTINSLMFSALYLQAGDIDIEKKISSVH